MSKKKRAINIRKLEVQSDEEKGYFDELDEEISEESFTELEVEDSSDLSESFGHSREESGEESEYASQ